MGKERGEILGLTRISELSLTVPITNSLAFLFTVLGDWYVDRKVISRGICSHRYACDIC